MTPALSIPPVAWRITYSDGYQAATSDPDHAFNWMRTFPNLRIDELYVAEQFLRAPRRRPSRWLRIRTGLQRALTAALLFMIAFALIGCAGTRMHQNPKCNVMRTVCLP